MKIPGLILLTSALASFIERPFRSLLTMLGIVCGVASVFISISLGEASKEEIRKNLDSVSARTMTVFPDWSGRSSRQRPWKPFTENDLLEIQALNGVYAATGSLDNQYTVVSEASDWNTDVRGIDTSYLKASDLTMDRGIEITDVDIGNSASVAVIGSSAARSLFPNQDPVGQRIKIQNIPFRIIGLTNQKGGESWRGRDEDNFVLIPRSTGRARLFGDNRLARQQVRGITIVGETQQALSLIEKDVDLILRRSRGLSADEPPDYRIFNFSANRQNRAKADQTIDFMFKLFAGVALIVGGVGVINIMLATVTERTREIGLRKALGARRTDILSLFLFEAVIIAMISGVIGLIVGYYAAEYLASTQDMKVKYTRFGAGLAFLSAFITGVVSGFIPAFNASRLDPVEALRNE